MIAMSRITTQAATWAWSSYTAFAAGSYSGTVTSGGSSSNDTTIATNTFTEWVTNSSSSSITVYGTSTESYSTFDDYDTDFNPITATLTASLVSTVSTSAAPGRTTASTTSATTSARTKTNSTSYTVSQATATQTGVTMAGAESEATATDFVADWSRDLLVFTASGWNPITAGTRTTSTRITRGVVASVSLTAPAPGYTIATHTVTVDMHKTGATVEGIAVFNGSTSATVSTYFAGQLPPSSGTYTTLIGKTISTRTQTSNSRTETFTARQTKETTLTYSIYATGKARYGTGTTTFFDAGASLIGNISSSSSTRATATEGWNGTSTSTATYPAKTTPTSDFTYPSGTATYSTFRTELETIRIFSNNPALNDIYWATSRGTMDNLITEAHGWNPVSTAFSAAPVSLGLTAAAVVTVYASGSSVAPSVLAPVPYPATTMLITSTGTTYPTATVRFGTNSEVSSSWTTTNASTTRTTTSGTMSFAGTLAAQTLTRTQRASQRTTSGAVDMVCEPGILFAINSTGGTTTSFFSSDSHHVATYTTPVELKHFRAIPGPCIVEVDKYNDLNPANY